MLGYELVEEDGWSMNVPELEKKIQKAGSTASRRGA